MANEAYIIFCNCSGSEAESLAEKLVSQKLAACVNIIPAVKSFYIWQDEMQKDEENTLIIKTSGKKLEGAILFLEEEHSYDVPEILALEVHAGNSSYLKWLNEQTGA